jgi:hypothetical protein
MRATMRPPAFVLLLSILRTTLPLLSCLPEAAHAAPPRAPASEESKKAAPQSIPKPPADGATAILFGKRITAKPGDELTGTIGGELFKRYAEENKIRVTDAHVHAFIAASDRSQKESIEEWKRDKKTLEEELKSEKLGAAERKEKEKKLVMYTKFVESERETETFKKANPATDRKMNRELAEKFILSWKINQSLFRKYGGRVIFQQAGPEPLDAYRKFLKEREKKGDFQLLTDEARQKFWEYFTNDRMHTFLDKAGGREAMTTPWWLKPADKEE